MDAQILGKLFETFEKTFDANKATYGEQTVKELEITLEALKLQWQKTCPAEVSKVDEAKIKASAASAEAWANIGDEAKSKSLRLLERLVVLIQAHDKVSNVELRQCKSSYEAQATSRFLQQYSEGREWWPSKEHLEVAAMRLKSKGRESLSYQSYMLENDERRSESIATWCYAHLKEKQPWLELAPEPSSCQIGALLSRTKSFQEMLQERLPTEEWNEVKASLPMIDEEHEALLAMIEPMNRNYKVTTKMENLKLFLSPEALQDEQDKLDSRPTFEENLAKIPPKIRKMWASWSEQMSEQNASTPVSVSFTEMLLQYFEWQKVAFAAKEQLETNQYFKRKEQLETEEAWAQKKLKLEKANKVFADNDARGALYIAHAREDKDEWAKTFEHLGEVDMAYIFEPSKAASEAASSICKEIKK